MIYNPKRTSRIIMTTIPYSREYDPTSAEAYQLGIITDVENIAPERFGLAPAEQPAAIYEVSVEDPYVEFYDKATRAEIAEAEQSINDYAAMRREAGFWERKPGVAYTDEDNVSHDKNDWGDPVSKRFHFTQTVNGPDMDAWVADVPNATALAVLADPRGIPTITDKAGNTHVIQEESRKWWSLCTDAVGIRSRATVMAELVKGYISDEAETGADAIQGLKWLSIACGTALPTMKAAVHSGLRPNLTLVDFSNDSMGAVETLADEIGFEGNIEKKRMNIFNPASLEKLGRTFDEKGGRPKLVDMMGIFEYTGDNLGVDSVNFLKSGYDLVAPGGKLVFGQMRSDRPVDDFTMGVVGWPYVEQRSVQDVMKLITDAGIPAERVNLFLPKDGVYTVVTVDKPSATVALAA